MATDNFPTNGDPIGAPWVSGVGALDQLAVKTNQLARSDLGGEFAGGYYSAAASSPDQYAECTIATGDAECGPAVRVSDTVGTLYWMDAVGGGEIHLYRSTDTGGTFGTAAVGTNPIGTWVNGDVFRLEIAGSTLTAKKNGATLVTRTDGTLTTGQPGAFIYGSNSRLDNWSGGDLVSITWDQEGYRWRNDDGSEVTATYIAAQDTNP